MEKIAGPFGFWTFPILNTLITIFSSQSSTLNNKPISDHPPVISNEEQWSWIDYKGNKREITVHRKVKST